MTALHTTEATAAAAGGAASETWLLATTSGLVFHVPPSMSSLTTYVLLEQERWFEPEMSLLPRLLQPGMNALDIGANHGLYAMEMARCTQTGQVWAFEPTAVPRSSLLRSVQDNGLADRVTVVAAGLAECAAQASFAVGDNSELNSRSGAGERRETVQLLALDDYLDAHADGVPIGFIKLDAEGGELQVLAGARRFFQAQSPVVLFELKHGPAINTALIDGWLALGYGMFRWSAELKLLLPFDLDTDETDFALNLVAVRPAQQAELAERGLLVTAADLQTVMPPAPDPQTLATWCTLTGQSLAQLTEPFSAADTAHLRALNAVTSAHLQPGLRPAERVALVVAAQIGLTLQAGSAASLGAEAGTLLVHCLYALGRQHAAVKMAAGLLNRWRPGLVLTLPFLPPQLHELDRPRSTASGSWLQQVLGEFVATKSTLSSYFAPPCPERWAQLLQHPDHSADIERRYLLSHMVQDRMVALDGLRWLPAPEHTCNPQLWQALLQATRAMVGEPSAATPPTAWPASANAVLAGLPVPAVTIVDVGASPLGDETEPYAPLLRAGRARVTGFEPDAQALQQLHRLFPDTQTHRHLPHFVGDGEPAVFHETEWSLTASLFEPNRPMLDRYHRLGELVREKARHTVPTARLDDLIAPGQMDVLKIDVQGAERLVFDGAPQRLDECLVVWTEVEFVPLYRDQPLFGDIDARLRSHGLQFLCFAGLAHRALATWPPAGPRVPQRPQQLWADAIFVPQPERIAALTADAAARLALAAHHMLGAYDLCHAALLRHDGLAGSDFAARYLLAMQAV
jgi:FkbM family methyltransferase